MPQDCKTESKVQIYITSAASALLKSIPGHFSIDQGPGVLPNKVQSGSCFFVVICGRDNQVVLSVCCSCCLSLRLVGGSLESDGEAWLKLFYFGTSWTLFLQCNFVASEM